MLNENPSVEPNPQTTEKSSSAKPTQMQFYDSYPEELLTHLLQIGNCRYHTFQSAAQLQKLVITGEQ